MGRQGARKGQIVGRLGQQGATSKLCMGVGVWKSLLVTGLVHGWCVEKLDIGNLLENKHWQVQPKAKGGRPGWRPRGPAVWLLGWLQAGVGLVGDIGVMQVAGSVVGSVVACKA